MKIPSNVVISIEIFVKYPGFHAQGLLTSFVILHFGRTLDNGQMRIQLENHWNEENTTMDDGI